MNDQGDDEKDEKNYLRLRETERAMAGMLSKGFGEGKGGLFLQPIQVRAVRNSELDASSPFANYYDNPSIDVMAGIENKQEAAVVEPEGGDEEQDLGEAPDTTVGEIVDSEPEASESYLQNAPFAPSGEQVGTGNWTPPQVIPEPPLLVKLPVEVPNFGKLKSAEVAKLRESKPPKAEQGATSSSRGQGSPAPPQGTARTETSQVVEQTHSAVKPGSQQMGARREEARVEQARASGIPYVSSAFSGGADVESKPGNYQTEAESAMAGLAIEAGEAMSFATSVMIDAVQKIIGELRNLSERVHQITSSLDSEGKDDHEF